MGESWNQNISEKAKMVIQSSLGRRVRLTSWREVPEFINDMLKRRGVPFFIECYEDNGIEFKLSMKRLPVQLLPSACSGVFTGTPGSAIHFFDREVLCY